MKSVRNLTQNEERLLCYLVKKASMSFSYNLEKDLLVQNMNDGRMGSLYLYPNGNVNKERLFGKCVSELMFIDKDGVEVIVSLYVDKEGDLFELDVWKTDFSPLLEFPDNF